MAPRNGTYLQDGKHLYIFRCLLPQQEGVVLEDARTDRMFSISMKEYRKAGMKQVRPMRPTT